MRRLFLSLLLLALGLPSFATQPNPTKRQLELAHKLLEVTNAMKSMAATSDAMLGQMEQQYFASMEANGSDAEAVAEGKEFFAAYREEAKKIDFTGLMLDAFVRIYATRFSEKELADTIAFYESPSGRKFIDLNDDVSREGMTVASALLMPKVTELVKNVTEAHEKKRPWRRTMSDIESVASALDSWSIDHDELYPTGDYASLKEQLAEYMTKFPEKDIWGHAYAYVVSDDRTRFRLVSAGADSIFDWDSRRIMPAPKAEVETEVEVRYRERLEDDFIYADEAFIQLPVQAKPRAKE